MIKKFIHKEQNKHQNSSNNHPLWNSVARFLPRVDTPLNKGCLISLLFFALFVGYLWFNQRDISFDEHLWKSDASKWRPEYRFRMKNDVSNMLSAKKWSLSEILDVFGAPDETNMEDVKSDVKYLYYRMGNKFYYFDGFYMTLRFYKDGDFLYVIGIH